MIEEKILEALRKLDEPPTVHDLKFSLMELYPSQECDEAISALMKKNFIYISHGYIHLVRGPIPSEPPMEVISRETLAERERCIQIIWDNRGKCASNQAALALMNEINGNV